MRSLGILLVFRNRILTKCFFITHTHELKIINNNRNMKYKIKTKKYVGQHQQLIKIIHKLRPINIYSIITVDNNRYTKRNTLYNYFFIYNFKIL